MGNKASSRRPVVDERYTRPQGFDEHKEGDYRKLRRLILNGQLAPCYPGAEECAFELDECPICFLFYPSLNRTRCCSKAICTECYLQIKSLDFGRYTHCPFCKTSSYTVEYRGAKTPEEKGFEQAEEQKVIEAKIRIRQKELHDEEERVLRLGEDTQAEELGMVSAREQGLHLFNAPNSHRQVLETEDPFEHRGIIESSFEGEHGMSAHRAYLQGPLHCSDRYDGFDLDVEDIMYMEAIWLSLQEQGQIPEEVAVAAQQIPTSNALMEAELRSMAGGRRLGTGGLAGALAASAPAEREAINAHNRMGSQVVKRNHADMTSLRCRDLDTRYRTMDSSRMVASADKAIEVERQKGTSDWMLDPSSETAEVGTSFSFNIPATCDLAWETPNLSPDEACLSSTSTPLLPESFEEQIMLAMAMSLAEGQAQARRR
eukprot:c16039_g1_i2 orf=546-1835(-)